MKLADFFYLSLFLLLFASSKAASSSISKKDVGEKEYISLNEKSKLKNSEIAEIESLNDDDEISYLTKQLINNAMNYFGVRYRLGGTTRSGMDCSGLIFKTFDLFEIKVPRNSFELSKIGTKIKNSNIKKGDLVFFKTNSRRKQINHVGLVVEVLEDEIKFIHASIQKGVIISSTKEPYYKNSFVQANRILD